MEGASVVVWVSVVLKGIGDTGVFWGTPGDIGAIGGPVYTGRMLWLADIKLAMPPADAGEPEELFSSGIIVAFR